MSYTLASPAMTSMVAAPAMTSMYAGAPASMYAPASVMQAAPVTTVAAPAASYVAAPVTYAAPTAALAAPQPFAPGEKAGEKVAAPSFVIPPFSVPAPVSMAAGLPTPEKLAAERDAYDKALDAQLAKQSNAVMEECKIKQLMLQQACKTQIAEYQLKAEEDCKMACFQVERDANAMVNGLKEAAIMQRSSVDERMAHGIAEHKKLFALEEMEKKSYALKKEWFEKEAKFTYDYQKVMQAGSRAITPGYGMEQVAPVPTFQGAVSAVPATTTLAAAPATYAAPIQAVANYGAVPTSTII